MKLYFECNSGISGDMSVAALIGLGASKEKLEKALSSMGLNDEFNYRITNVNINSIKAVDFDVEILNELSNNHHCHRNLADVCRIIDKADATQDAKDLAKKIFRIVAEAEAKVHDKKIDEIHFHEIGAIDSIVDIVSFAVLFDDLKPKEVYFSTLCEGQGFIECQHGILSVPVPAVCEIISQYAIPIKFTQNNGEMITPTGAAIVAALFKNNKLDNEFIIEKIGYGAGKRKYKNPILRIMQIK